MCVQYVEKLILLSQIKRLADCGMVFSDKIQESRRRSSRKI